MRHFDISGRPSIRAWPELPGQMHGRARPMIHGLRSAALIAGRLLDAAVVAAAGLWAPVLTGGAQVVPLAVAAVALVLAHALAAAGLYESEAGYGGRRALAQAILVCLLTVPPAAAFAALLSAQPLPPVLAWAGLAALGLALTRPLMGLALKRAARWTQAARRVLVVGDRERALEALSLIAGDNHHWAFPVGLCLDRDPPARPVLGGFITGLDQVEQRVRGESVDDIIVALPWQDSARLAHCLEVLKPLAVDVHLFPDAPAPFADGNGLSLLGGVPMARLGARPLAGWRRVAKEAEDRILGALLLVLLAPIMAVIALAIKWDSPGPVLFRQSRYGYDNQPFTCFKFRSMVVRPEEIQVRQASREDPRITCVGRVLRRTSLDELPQLINVVLGTMSLVGPRPHAVSHHHHYARLVDDYRCRHRMKPGITGWAQVNGYRGETATVELMRKRVRHDLWYIDHWSLGLDLLILLRTPLACLKATNAY